MPSKLRVTFIQRFVHGKYNAIINRYNPAAIKATASEMRLYSTVKCVRLAFKTGKLYSPPKKKLQRYNQNKTAVSVGHFFLNTGLRCIVVSLHVFLTHL